MKTISICSYIQAAGPAQRVEGLYSASSRRGLLSGSGSHRCCTPDAYASRGEHTPFSLIYILYLILSVLMISLREKTG